MWPFQIHWSRSLLFQALPAFSSRSVMQFHAKFSFFNKSRAIFGSYLAILKTKLWLLPFFADQLQAPCSFCRLMKVIMIILNSRLRVICCNSKNSFLRRMIHRIRESLPPCAAARLWYLEGAIRNALGRLGEFLLDLL